MKRREGGAQEKGTAVVESALTLLMFFIMLFAIMEGGRFLNVQHILTNAAREGARLASAPLSRTSTMASVEEIEAEVGRFLNAASIGGATITVERPVVIPTTTSAIECTRIRVEVPYRVISLSMFSVLEVTLSGEALMRNETSP